MMVHASNTPIRLLILEDSVSDAELALRKLAVSGMPIDGHIARSAVEFKHKLNAETFDVILCDFTLPGWSGLDALRWLRQSGSQVPFIYVSGTLGEETAVECIKQGATDYVLKGNLERLPHAVRRSLEEQELRRQRAYAERELEKSEEQYRLLFESNPQPMWVFDRDTLKFLAVNQSAIGHYGYSRDEFLSMTILDIRPAEDVERVIKVAMGGRPQKLQHTERWKHRVRDGRIIDVEITSHDITFLGRTARLVLAVDITERLRIERQHRQAEEMFSKAFRSCPLAITISTVAEGRYLDANDAFLRMVGYHRADLAGRRAVELNIWAFPQDRETMIRELERSGRVGGLETVFNSKSSGPRQVQLFAERIQLEGTPCVLAITHDVTDSKKLEEEFRQAQKMEAVGRLAGGIAHDFNNMLGIILGYCDLAEGRSVSDSTRKDVDHIKKAAQRAANLTRQLLAFSRKQTVRPSVFNLNVVVREFNQMLHRVLPSYIELRFQPADQLGNIKADLGQMEQVLVNLVVNARDAMSSAGKIMIETQNVELDETYARQQPGVTPGRHVLLSISDTGSGMTQETISRIFEPFFTTKLRGEGSGLGLSMVYGVVQESRGHISVSSELGVGTTFRLYFPRVEDLAEPRPIVALATTVTRGSETVLVVEDEDALRQLIVKLLENEGYRVLDASDGQTAMAISTQHKNPIDILVTDVVLPGMNGGEIAVRLREARPDLKVLYISGYIGDFMANQPSPDAASILEKPFTRQSLLGELRHLLDQPSA